MESKQLSMVKEQAIKKQRQLSERFEKAYNFVQNERKQLLQLQEYEADYLVKIKQEQHQWTAENTGRYRQFCHQLASAIRSQSAKLSDAELQLQQMRQSLCEQQQRINVLNDVIEREQQAAIHHTDKILQKEMDDHSSRLYLR
jgi:flagellar export protein FliJ